MKHWLKVEVFGGLLTSLSLAMFALGIALANPVMVFADDGTVTPPNGGFCGSCDKSICMNNMPRNCGQAAPNGKFPCNNNFCICNCITVGTVCDCAP